MKHQLLKVFTGCYIAFAILAAHSALAPTQNTPPICSSDRVVMVEAESPLLHNQRLASPDQNGLVARPLEGFTIRYYGASWCPACVKAKAEIPKLREAGAKVKVFDIDIDRAPRRIKVLPTMLVFKSGKLTAIIVGYKTCDEIVALLTE